MSQNPGTLADGYELSEQARQRLSQLVNRLDEVADSQIKGRLETTSNDEIDRMEESLND